ncbi:hypothetical protein [Halorhodospira halophila]|uniref:Uncharacterized protein n=1 Tax=Halorhodospira halophila (strain DSM 244 / SL1) TaxID=349124 RepID=A1WU65_HALHL|nr:hypothetical protein [Halorhodospira halophila]ABM61227.1 hypothetical protein Hhal_0439 [Halorhodospira halophila SL1]MBK1730041.1 hypothetical protein [Halorhodospira halophila]
MSIVSGVGTVAGLFGAYQGYQAQQRAQETREDQTNLLREQLEVAHEKKHEYADALRAVEKALEQVNDSGAIEPEQLEALERKGLNIDEQA